MSSISLGSISTTSGLILKGGAISAPQSPAVKMIGMTNGGNLAVTNNTPIVMPNTLYDRTAMYNKTNGKTTVTQAGVYLVNATLYLSAAVSGALLVYVNGTNAGSLFQQNSTQDASLKGSTVVNCNAGDVITIVPSSNISIFIGDTATSQISITYLS